jgi:cephalosporin-C deacetylase-like acetyl esterase
MLNPYLYTRLKDGVNCNLTAENNLGRQFKVILPSALTTPCLGNNPIQGEYLFPKGQAKAPLVILVHGMGDRCIIPCRMMARTLAKRGIASFVLYLVFYKLRAPDVMKQHYPGLSAEEWFESYRISVTDVRQVLDWAATRPEIIQDQISIAGISFGSFISSIAMGLDNRIKAGVLIVSGGNTDKLTRHSLLLRWQYKHSRAEYLQNQQTYAKYLDQVSKKGFENVEPNNSSYFTDPMTYSSYIKDRPVAMFNAIWDEIIPRAATLDLWQSYGRPPIRWYPATHASIWAWYLLMGPQIAGFLESAFKKIG